MTQSRHSNGLRFHVKTIILITTILVIGFIPAFGSEYPGCDVTKETQVNFSTSAATDRLSISISGQPCYEASLSITITAQDGRQLYSYEAPFKSHIAIQWDDPGIDADAEKFAVELFDDYRFGMTSDLPAWLPEDDYYESNYQVVQIERDYYEVLRENQWPTFSHPIHYEGWKVIAFDRGKNESVVVSEGGL